MRDMWHIFKDKTLVFIKVDSNNVCWFHIQKFNKSFIHVLGWQWLWILVLFKNRYENSLYVWCKIWREGMKGRKWNRGDLIPSFQNRDGESSRPTQMSFAKNWRRKCGQTTNIRRRRNESELSLPKSLSCARKSFLVVNISNRGQGMI